MDVDSTPVECVCDTRPDHIAFASARDRFYEGAAAGVTVLIVENDGRTAFALTALLERGDMTVVAAESGPVALDILTYRADIDILLMDITMPVMNGYQAISAIRRRPAHADVPIIALTGKAGGERERERCKAAGASDYVAKPIDSAALPTVISHWLLTGAAP